MSISLGRLLLIILLVILFAGSIYFWLVMIPTSPSDSGLEGIVLIGPTRPEGRDLSSSYEPFAATIVVQNQDRTNDLMTVRTGQNGTFRVLLPPGNYWINPIAPNPGAPPSASPMPVVVEPHRFTVVEVRFDTGLR